MSNARFASDSASRAGALAAAAPEKPARPRLELSGPRLAGALETLVARAEDNGGIERYVDALKLKGEIFARVLGEGRARGMALEDFRALCPWMSTVRRRIGAYVEPQGYPRLRERIAELFEGAEDTSTTDARVAAFCAAFPADRAHRWVRDLAAELLHHADAGRYPIMARWVWDAAANTGVLREIWHGEDVDNQRIDVPDGYETHLALREELAQFLASQGVYRDVMHYVDLLVARVYAAYIHERGGTYLRPDFASPEEPMVHVRRLLGLDGVAENGRTRLKAADGTAAVVEDPPRLE